MTETVVLRTTSHVAELVLNRPEQLNALTLEMVELLDAHLQKIEANPGLRVVVVRGAGKGFCSGSDLRERLSSSGAHASPRDLYLERLREAIQRLESLPMPTLAAIDGAAVGAGLELALACDLRIATSRSRLGFPEVGIGTIPAGGGTQRLPRLIGIASAKALLLTGAILPAGEAASIGLLHRVVADGELSTVIDTFVAGLVSCAPLAVRFAKLAANASQGTDLDAGLELEAAFAALLSNSRDREEGIRAFLEKRRATFVGE